MASTFSEKETEDFYDEHNEYYKSFWDPKGSLHWGYYKDLNQNISFINASECHSERMAKYACIDKNSVILDMGCGNGNSSLFLAKKYGCEVHGMDISQVRINDANKLKDKNPDLKLKFIKGTGTDLPFEDNTYTHVWVEAVIYHIPDKRHVLKEIYRVLKPNGIFAMDDLTKPIPAEDVTDEAKKYVYDRLLFDTEFSHSGYADFMKKTGFIIAKDEDISEHLWINYDKLSYMAKIIGDEEQFFKYRKMCKCIKEKQLGWSFFIAIKAESIDDFIYNSKNINGIYDLIADNYNEMVKDYLDVVREICNNNDFFDTVDGEKILELGAGTGIVGKVINENNNGKYILHGIDISENMLELALRSNTYDSVYRYNLNETFDLPCYYDKIISFGTFTKGHVNPLKLFLHTRHLADGGKLFISMRKDIVPDGFMERFNLEFKIDNTFDLIVMDNVKLTLIEATKKYKKLKLHVDHIKYGETTIFYDFLRSNSDDYYDFKSGQKIRSWDFDSSITDRTFDGNSIHITWSDGYTTDVPLRRVFEYCKEEKNYFYGMPTMENECNVYDLSDLLTKNKIMNNVVSVLKERGIVIVRNCDDVKKLGKLISPIKPTIYGDVFNVVNDENYENIANSTFKIPMHMDLQYYEKPPGIQLLNCVELEDCKGGENVFVDIHKIINRMKKDKPKYFDVLSKTNMLYYYENKDYKFKNSKPIIELDIKGNIKSINWSFYWEKTPTTKQYKPLFKDAYNYLKDQIDNEKSLKLKPKVGQCIIFLNNRILHSRTNYSAKKRRLEGCYLDLFEFCARYRKLINE